jgi:hypothetical protein
MSGLQFYVLEGKEVRKCASIDEYVRLVSDNRIKWTKVSDKIVSTIFFGFDHRVSFGDEDDEKEPILFETMVFPDRIYVRYHTYDEAVKGHDEIVEKIRSGGGLDGGNDAVREKIEVVVKYAVEHPTTLEDLLAICSEEKLAVGYNDNHCLIIPNRYRAVYSLEHQPNGRLYHHLSVSIVGKRKRSVPHPKAVELIAEEFGMLNHMKGWSKIWLEDNAVNVLQEVEE